MSLSLSLFYEHGKLKLRAAISPVKEATKLHTRLDKNSQIVLMLLIIHDLPETTVRDLTALSEQPALACHCPQSFSVNPSAWSSFAEHEFGFSMCTNLNIRSFNLSFQYMATSKQTYTRTCAMQSR